MYYALYDMILNYWFPPMDGYGICPKWSIPGKTIDFSITYVVEYHGHPLLLVEIKPPSDFRFDSKRDAAIVQVTQRLDEVGPNNQHTNRLYAISAIGKRWRACYALKGRGSKGGQSVKGIADVDSLRSSNSYCWNPDITSDASYEAFESIVEIIKSYDI
jgi:hypothetical protein